MTIRPAPQPPYPVELLAELHADNLPPDLTAQLWQAVRSDPEARRVLSALDMVSERLREHGKDLTVETPIPADVAARIERAIAAESSFAPVAEVAGRSPRRGRSSATRWLLAAAAVVIVATGAVTATTLRVHPVAPSAQPAPVDLGADLRPSTVLAAMERKDKGVAYGPLSDRSALAACLTSVGADRALVATLNVTFRGKDAVLIVTAGRVRGNVTALVVSPGCAPGNTAVLAEAEF